MRAAKRVGQWDWLKAVSLAEQKAEQWADSRVSTLGVMKDHSMAELLDCLWVGHSVAMTAAPMAQQRVEMWAGWKVAMLAYHSVAQLDCQRADLWDQLEAETKEQQRAG